MVARRHVFFVAGYDPIDPVSQHRRFQREAAQFRATWNATTAISELEQSDDGLSARWRVIARGPNWRAETTYELLCWHDLVLADMARSTPRRLFEAVVSFGDYLISGTILRFFRAFWRFGLFFLAPFAEVAVFGVVAAVVGWMIAVLAPDDVLFALAWLALGIALFALLLQWPGRRWRVKQALALFTFAREYMHRRSDIDDRVDRFAKRLMVCTRAAEVDEILIVGHSLGAAIAVDAIARALAVDPNLGRHGPTLCVLTAGGTIPQMTLHPSADWLRTRVRRVAEEPAIAWAEFQARDDTINFYRFDPVTLTVSVDGDARKPQIRRVHLHEMLTKPTFRRHRWHFMRLHYQFVMANERRSMYDYFMLVCGPLPFATMLGAPRGPAELFADDGSCITTQAGSSQKAPALSSEC